MFNNTFTFLPLGREEKIEPRRHEEHEEKRYLGEMRLTGSGTWVIIIVVISGNLGRAIYELDLLLQPNQSIAKYQLQN
jgi:hypothetical protein